MHFLLKLRGITLYTYFHFIIVSANANVRQNIIPIIEYEIELTNERHLSTDFRYVTVNSKVLTDWNEIPDITHASLLEVDQLKECRITLTMGFLNYKPHLGKRTLCLFRNSKWANEMDPLEIEIDTETFRMTDLMTEIQPITGFVTGEPNSLVEGYLIDGYVDDKFFREKQDNAILFEYIGHEDQFGVLLPPEHITRVTRTTPASTKPTHAPTVNVFTDTAYPTVSETITEVHLPTESSTEQHTVESTTEASIMTSSSTSESSSSTKTETTSESSSLPSTTLSPPTIKQKTIPPKTKLKATKSENDTDVFAMLRKQSALAKSKANATPVAKQTNEEINKPVTGNHSKNQQTTTVTTEKTAETAETDIWNRFRGGDKLIETNTTEEMSSTTEYSLITEKTAETDVWNRFRGGGDKLIETTEEMISTTDVSPRRKRSLPKATAPVTGVKITTVGEGHYFTTDNNKSPNVKYVERIQTTGGSFILAYAEEQSNHFRTETLQLQEVQVESTTFTNNIRHELNGPFAAYNNKLTITTGKLSEKSSALKKSQNNRNIPVSDNKLGVRRATFSRNSLKNLSTRMVRQSPRGSSKSLPLSNRCLQNIQDMPECLYGLRSWKSCLKLKKLCKDFNLGRTQLSNAIHENFTRSTLYGDPILPARSLHYVSGHIRNKRGAVFELPLDNVAAELLKQNNDDIADDVRLLGGMSSSDVLDSLSDHSTVCNLCVWIQPHFAEKFGFHKSKSFAIGEIINILNTMNWLFRAMDFNNDGTADNVGFKIKSVVVTDDIKLNVDDKTLTALRLMSKYYKNKNETGQKTSRKKRSLVSGVKAEMDYMNSLLDSPFYDDPTGDITISKETGDNSIESEYLDLDPSEFVDVDDVPGSIIDKSRAVYSIDAREAYRSILKQIQNNSKFTDCCAVVGFIYHNLSPSLSVATRRGLCSSKNLALVSGMIHMHKVGKYDILRALMHAFGHLLGASHDNTMKGRCQDRVPSRFLNPFIMHPVQQLNVGLRPNSFRLSLCSKHKIVTFLSSNNAQCLVKERDTFCGNGMVDVGECASQCHDPSECCEERNTPFGCKLINRAESPVCDQP